MTWASDLGIIGDGATDCVPALNAALADAAVSTIEFGPGHFRFGSQPEQRSGSYIRGCGPSTILSPLPEFAFGPNGPHLTNGLLSTAPNSHLTRVSDLTLDGLGIGYTGNPNQSGLRIHGLVRRRALGFVVERVYSRNFSGYAFLVSGDDPVDNDRHCSGVIQDCRAENSDVLVEVGMCRDVTVRRVFGSDGDGTINCENAFLAWHGAENALFEDCEYTGSAGSGLAVISIGQVPVEDIIFRRCVIRMTDGSTALLAGWEDIVDKPYRVGFTVEDCDLSSAFGNCAALENADAIFRRTMLRGYNVCLGTIPEDTATLLLEDTDLLASNDPLGTAMAHALRLEAQGTVTITRGSLRAKGKTPVAYLKNNQQTFSLSAQTILEP